MKSSCCTSPTLPPISCTDPAYPSLVERNIQITFTAYTLRSLHILFFHKDLTCANTNFCKPYMFPNGYGGYYNACGKTNCCGVKDDICTCSSADVGYPLFT